MATVHKSQIAEERYKVNEFLRRHSDLFKFVDIDDAGDGGKRQAIGDYYFNEKTKLKTRLDLQQVRPCERKISGTQCTMRIIQKKFLNAESVRGLLFEVRSMINLSHPNVLKVYDAYQDDENVYVIEEHFDGRQLFDVIL